MSLNVLARSQERLARQFAGIDGTPVAGIFYSLKKARIVIERWRREYNEIRPHSSARVPSCSRNRKWCSRVTMVLVQKIGQVTYNSKQIK
jgi:hypothetical protein